MSDLTATVIGASGRMGREHVAAYGACGVEIVPNVFPGHDTNILSIASPDWEHDALIVTGFEEGQHVFCEKPLFVDQEGRDSVLSYSGSCHLGQNLPLRHQPIFTDLKDHDFCEIYRIEASYNWGRTHKLFEGWRAEDPIYSLVMGGLIHMVDLVLWLTELDMEVVSAIGCNKSAPGFPNHDTVTAQCRLSNGGVCNLTVDGGTGVKVHSHALRIHGTKDGIDCVNLAKTDKQTCIKEFARKIRAGEPPERDFRATEICLEIDRLATS